MPRKSDIVPTADSATALLSEDHRKVEQLFEQYEAARTATQKQKTVEEICLELIVHARIEEEIFYPTLREAADEAEDDLDEAQVEHDTLKVLLAELQAGSPKDDYYDAKVKVLSEYVKHHVEEEERTAESLFAKAREAGIDDAELLQKLIERKEDLMAEMKVSGPGTPEPVSFTSIELESA